LSAHIVGVDEHILLPYTENTLSSVEGHFLRHWVQRLTHLIVWKVPCSNFIQILAILCSLQFVH